MAPWLESQCCRGAPYKEAVRVDFGSVRAGCERKRAESFGRRGACSFVDGSKFCKSLRWSRGFRCLLSFHICFQVGGDVHFPSAGLDLSFPGLVAIFLDADYVIAAEDADRRGSASNKASV